MEGCKTENKSSVYYGVHVPSDEQIQEGEDGVLVYEVGFEHFSFETKYYICMLFRIRQKH